MSPLQKPTCSTELQKRTIGQHCHKGTNCFDVPTPPFLPSAVSLEYVTVRTRQTKQTCFYSTISLKIEVYVRLPAEIKSPFHRVLVVIKPLHSIQELGLQRHLKYVNHHIYSSGIIKSKFDPCILFRRKSGRLEACMTLQGNENVIAELFEFLAAEGWEYKDFFSKPRKSMKSESIVFKGI